MDVCRVNGLDRVGEFEREGGRRERGGERRREVEREGERWFFDILMISGAPENSFIKLRFHRI